MAAVKTHSVPAVDRALTILEVLAESEKGLSLAELARKLGLPRSSTHCLLLTLERHGYLHRHAQGHRYLFGRKLFNLANMAVAEIEVREQAAPFLKSLMQATGLAVDLAILERGEAVLVDKVESPSLLRPATWIGKHVDVHSTGTGKALMAHLSENELDLLVREHGMPRHNENTITSVRKFKEQLDQIRKLGYSVDDEEDQIGIRCLGAPIFDCTGNVTAALSVAGTISRLTGENLHLLAGKVVKTAFEISRQLGFSSQVATPSRNLEV